MHLLVLLLVHLNVLGAALLVSYVLVATFLSVCLMLLRLMHLLTLLWLQLLSIILLAQQDPSATRSALKKYLVVAV